MKTFRFWAGLLFLFWPLLGGAQTPSGPLLSPSPLTPPKLNQPLKATPKTNGDQPKTDQSSDEKASKPNAPGALTECLNCATIIAVHEASRRPKPLWMTGTTIDRLGTSNSPSNSAMNKPVVIPNLSSGAIINREQDAGLHRSHGFEITLQMNDGSTKVLTVSARPAYNIGSKVKIIGKTLIPDY